jgi:hypothetical protein
MSTELDDRLVRVAGRLLELGISREMILQLLSYPLDDLEAQIDWLKYRKARRQGAFLIMAVRRNYAPPKELYYANIKAIRGRRKDTLDQDTQRCDRPVDAETP